MEDVVVFLFSLISFSISTEKLLNTWTDGSSIACVSMERKNEARAQPHAKQDSKHTVEDLNQYSISRKTRKRGFVCGATLNII